MRALRKHHGSYEYFLNYIIWCIYVDYAGFRIPDGLYEPANFV